MGKLHGVPEIGMDGNNGRGSLTSRYFAALLAPALIAGVMQVTWPFFQHDPISPYLPAVIFCAWYGGHGPALLSVVISYLLSNFFFVEPYYFFWFPKQADLVSLLLFAVVGSLISVMSERMHWERRRAESNLSLVSAQRDRYAKRSVSQIRSQNSRSSARGVGLAKFPILTIRGPW